MWRFDFSTAIIRPSIFKLSTNLKEDALEDINLQKEFYDSMTKEEKRKLYKCGSRYITIDDIPSYYIYPKLYDKISLFKGDITALEVDAIVNTTNNRLMFSGGVNGAIHLASGKQLLSNECSLTSVLKTGESVLTSGYRLPARRIIHTVAPYGENPILLRNCYENSLNLAKQNDLRSIALPCVGTGICGYPNDKAAHVALRTVKNWLQKNVNSIDRIIFCCFLPIDFEIYNKLLPVYFP